MNALSSIFCNRDTSQSTSIQHVTDLGYTCDRMDDDIKDVKLNKDNRNQVRKVFLKELKKIIVLTNKTCECIKVKEIKMVKQAKIDDITIPIFDRANYPSWKIRLMTLLEYKECKEQATRAKIENDKIEHWNKSDLKATIIMSAL